MLEELYQNPVQFFCVIPRGVPLPHSNALQYYVKREKCKVNDVIFPSGCEARAINLDNKNMIIGIFTGGTSVRSKNVFTTISRYPTGKHEIMTKLYVMSPYNSPILVLDLSPGPVFTKHSHEHSVTFSPRFVKLNVTQLLIG